MREEAMELKGRGPGTAWRVVDRQGWRWEGQGREGKGLGTLEL